MLLFLLYYKCVFPDIKRLVKEQLFCNAPIEKPKK